MHFFVYHSVRVCHPPNIGLWYDVVQQRSETQYILEIHRTSSFQPGEEAGGSAGGAEGPGGTDGPEGASDAASGGEGSAAGTGGGAGGQDGVVRGMVGGRMGDPFEEAEDEAVRHPDFLMRGFTWLGWAEALSTPLGGSAERPGADAWASTMKRMWQCNTLNHVL